MAAVLKFDQSGKPAGENNRSRSDIDAGTAVAITNVSPGSSNSLELLWKPPEDDTAVISGSSPNWSITPKAGTSGTYRVKLTVDSAVSIHTFAVKTPNKDLIIPAANERADPDASLVQQTSLEIDASETNEAFGPFTSGSAFGWWKALEEVIRAIDEADGADDVIKQKLTLENKNMAALATSSDGDEATLISIALIPSNDGFVRVFVNGVGVSLGDGAKDKDCYFSDDGGTTARRIKDITNGDHLFWMGSVAGYELTTDDLISFDYNEDINPDAASGFDEGVYANTDFRYLADLQNKKILGLFPPGAKALTMIGGRKFIQLEQSYENKFKWSQQINQGVWSKARMTIDPNVETAPDGTNTADEAIPNTTNDSHYFAQSDNIFISEIYTLSILAKKSGWKYLRLKPEGIYYVDTPEAIFDLDAGTIYSQADAICRIEEFDNDYYLVSLTAECDSSGVARQWFFVLNDSADLSYSGDNVKGILAWQADFQKSGFPTSPILSSTTPRTLDADSFYWEATANVVSVARTLAHDLQWVPNAASTDTKADQVLYELYDSASGKKIRIVWEAATNKILVRKYDGSWSTIADTTAIVSDRGQLLTVTIDPVAGSVEITGATSGGAIDTTEAWDTFMPATAVLWYGMTSDPDLHIDGILSEVNEI